MKFRSIETERETIGEAQRLGLQLPITPVSTTHQSQHSFLLPTGLCQRRTGLLLLLTSVLQHVLHNSRHCFGQMIVIYAVLSSLLLKLDFCQCC